MDLCELVVILFICNWKIGSYWILFLLFTWGASPIYSSKLRFSCLFRCPLDSVLIFVRRRFWVTAQDRVFTAVFFQFARLTLVFGVASAPPESLCAGRSFFLWSCGVLRCICRLCYSPHARPSFCGRPSFSLPGPHPGSLLYFISSGSDPVEQISPAHVFLPRTVYLSSAVCF
jgi:hypothetical protein